MSGTKQQIHHMLNAATPDTLADTLAEAAINTILTTTPNKEAFIKCLHGVIGGLMGAYAGMCGVEETIKLTNEIVGYVRDMQPEAAAKGQMQ